MEFITTNYMNTTTQLTLTNNTGLADNLINRDPFFQYFTDGLGNDNTSASITVTFDEPTQVSRLALKDTNLKEFTIFYNGATANTFSLTTTGSTIASAWTTNSQNNIYMRCATTTVNSVTIDMKKTITANEEKVLGNFVISDVLYAMDRIPSARSYKPKVIPKQIVHKMSDGGTRIQTIRSKYAINISLDYISETQRDSIKEIYNLLEAFNFCPFGTTTGWDSVLFECVWDGEFDFYEYSDNAAVSGFSGQITLKETPY